MIFTDLVDENSERFLVRLTCFLLFFVCFQGDFTDRVDRLFCWNCWYVIDNVSVVFKKGRVRYNVTVLQFKIKASDFLKNILISIYLYV